MPGLTSARFRSALRSLALGVLDDWIGATRCRLFGQHAWRVLRVINMPCGGSEVVIVCPRCDGITLAQHFCDDEHDEGGGQTLPKPSPEHLKGATQPSPEIPA